MILLKRILHKERVNLKTRFDWFMMESNRGLLYNVMWPWIQLKQELWLSFYLQCFEEKRTNISHWFQLVKEFLQLVLLCCILTLCYGKKTVNVSCVHGPHSAEWKYGRQFVQYSCTFVSCRWFNIELATETHIKLWFAVTVLSYTLCIRLHILSKWLQFA